VSWSDGRNVDETLIGFKNVGSKKEGQEKDRRGETLPVTEKEEKKGGRDGNEKGRGRRNKKGRGETKRRARCS
jgi:hypothetical protein